MVELVESQSTLAELSNAFAFACKIALKLSSKPNRPFYLDVPCFGRAKIVLTLITSNYMYTAMGGALGAL